MTMFSSTKLRLVAGLLGATLLAGCSALQNDPEMLSPPPRSDLDDVTDQMSTDSLVMGATGALYDTASFVPDTGDIKAIDAASLQLQRLPRRRLEGLTRSSRGQGQDGRDRNQAFAQRDTLKGGWFRSRFGGNVRSSGQIDSRADKDRDRGITFGEETVNRDSIWMSKTTWKEADAIGDSLIIHQRWTRLFQHLTPGRPLGVRSMIWPNNAGVVARRADEIKIATGWVSVNRISGFELRCMKGAEATRDEEMGGQLRLVAHVKPYRGEGLINTGMETRRMQGCSVSAMGADRVAAFKFDLHTSINRATTLGARFFLSPPRPR